MDGTEQPRAASPLRPCPRPPALGVQRSRAVPANPAAAGARRLPSAAAFEGACPGQLSRGLVKTVAEGPPSSEACHTFLPVPSPPRTVTVTLPERWLHRPRGRNGGAGSRTGEEKPSHLLWTRVSCSENPSGPWRNKAEPGCVGPAAAFEGLFLGALLPPPPHRTPSCSVLFCFVFPQSPGLGFQCSPLKASGGGWRAGWSQDCLQLLA